MSVSTDRDGVTKPGSAVIGRAAERAAIDGLLAAACRAESSALVLAGPPGIGTSTLVEYAIDAAAGFSVLGIVGVESERGLAYAGVHQLVLPVLDGLQRLPAPQRAALDAVLGWTQHDAIDTYLVGLAVLSLVADAATTQPVLVVIDDAHWLDDESAVALSFVARRLHAERIAMVVALADDSNTSVRFEHLRRVDLVGLDESEALELLTRSAPAPIDPTVATRIVAATGGHPLALVEVLASLTVAQLGAAVPLPEPLPIGDRLSDLFSSRIRVLDGDAQMVLLLAASERFGDPVLLRRAAEATVQLLWDDAVAAAEATGVITFTPTVAFSHPLVRSAVYYSAAPTDRRRAHAALAGALDTDIDTGSDSDADRRAWHLGAAAAGPDERVAHLLEAAADRALRRGGASVAAAYLWRAFELTPKPERAAERLLEATRAEVTAGHGAQVPEILERARATGLGSDQVTDAAWTEALAHIIAGNPREAATILADVLPQIGISDTRLAVGSCFAADVVLLACGHLVEDPTRRTIAAGTSAVLERCDVPGPLAALVESVAAHVAAGRIAAAPMLRSALTCASSDQTRLQTVAGRHIHVVYLETVLAACDLLDDQAWDELTRAWAQVARATGALSALPLALSLRSWLEVLQGRLGSAVSHLTEIEDIVSLTGSRGLLGSPAPAFVLREAWLGNEEATRSGARRAMRDAHERGQGIGVDYAYLALTVLELGAGRYDAALRSARRVVDHDNVGLAPLALADLVEAASRCGEMDVARDAVERLSERATTTGTPWASGLLARSRALVDTGHRADEGFRLALDDLSRTTMATDTARTQLLHGEWLRRARRRKDAREPLHEALDFFEAIGASAFAERACAELAATGEHVRSRSAPVNVLTPQEAQIARLAASGERNRDIAAQLYISTSTVEYHLRKIFVKLGVTSRTQLAHTELPI